MYGNESGIDDAEDAEQDDELPPWEDGDNGDDEASPPSKPEDCA